MIGFWRLLAADMSLGLVKDSVLGTKEESHGGRHYMSSSGFIHVHGHTGILYMHAGN